MLTNKQKTLSLAVAGASAGLTFNATAATLTVTTGADSGAGSLREAIANAASGDAILIDEAVTSITLASSLTVSDKSLLISAPVDAQGKPRVSLSAGSAGYRLLELESSAGPESPVPFVVSGLRFSGAEESGAGGAILSDNHVLVLDKSIVTGNTAVGVGGGIAAYGGELCLQGSELSDNAVSGDEGPEGQYAIGGGAAVNGILNVVPSLSDGSETLNCLSSDLARDLFYAVSPSFDTAIQAVAGNPEGVEVIASEITGNSALLEAEVDFAERKYIALGGGLAVLESNFDQKESFLLGRACNNSGVIGGKYESEEELSRQCTTVFASSISGNSAVVDTSIGSYEPEYNVAAGGGIFLGSPGVELGLLLSAKYADISDNSVAVEGAGATWADVVVGGGVGALNSSIPFGVSEFWDSITGVTTCSDSGKYCGSQVALGASTVTGNTATFAASAAGDDGDPRDLVAGAGVGALVLLTDDMDVDKYDTAPGVQAAFSSIAGNTLGAAASEEFVSAFGGGVASGISIIDGPEEFISWQDYGKYFGIFSGNSGNSVTVTGANDTDLRGFSGGGGLVAPAQFLIGSKPQFAIISEEEPEEKYGLPATDALFTSPGGISSNSVAVNATGGEIAVAAVGGGTAATAKYSGQFGLYGKVVGNSVTVSAPSSEGELLAIGGGIGVAPLEDDGRELFAALKYMAVRDNAITVTDNANLDVRTLGGGIGLTAGVSDEPESNFDFGLSFSEVSGNSISLSSGAGDSTAYGGGIAVEHAGTDSKYGTNILASTIANNSLTMPGAGLGIAGAGVFLEVKYDSLNDDSAGGIVDATIAGNTGAYQGAPAGGQLAVVLDPGPDAGFPIINTLISGETAQGEDGDFYYEGAPEDFAVEATAVFHGADSPAIDGFLAPALADPAFLDMLQYNGGGDADKYGFSGDPATIALLPGSGAIDPTEANTCLSVASIPADQRGFPRDVCRDLGAYERLAETDGDGLADDEELSAPGTDPDILASMPDAGPSSRYGIVLASGDGNSDGIPDVNQSSVASFSSEAAGELTLYVVDDEWPLGPVTQIPGIQAGGFDLSLGGVSFSVLTGTSTDPVEMALIVPAQPGRSVSLVKQQCNPVPENPADGWQVISTGSEPFGEGRVRLTFELQPDGPFDCNGSAENIEDPVFVARSGGPAPVPSMPAVMYVLMSGALGLAGLFGLRARRRKNLG